MGFISSLGVLEDGEVSFVFPSELPPTLWLGRGWIRLSSHLYCACQRQNMKVLSVSRPVKLWELSAVNLWQGDR